jgi:sulfatase maturation enzyme AslB (radical SAM superfamily)
VAVGSVKDDALRAAPLLELRPWEQHEPCHDCAYLPVCMGGCLAGQYLRTGRRDQVLCKKAWFEAGFAETIPRRYLDELAAVPWDGEEAKATPAPSQIDATEGSPP